MKLLNMIYGTAWKKENTTSLVFQALMQGFKALDTACQPKHYREDLVGLGLLKAYESGIKREDLFLQTKFTPIDGQDKANMPYLESDDIKTQIHKSFEVSKKNLHTDFIDSYILHSPVYPASKLQIVWEKMEEFVEKKEVGHLGISNCYEIETLKFLYENAKVKPKFVQNRFYAQSGYDKEIREFCKQNSIIYQSFWSLTANPQILNSEILSNLSKKYQKSEAVIFYRFLNQINIVPLNGTNSKQHMIEDLAFCEFELTNDEINEISKFLI